MKSFIFLVTLFIFSTSLNAQEYSCPKKFAEISNKEIKEIGFDNQENELSFNTQTNEGYYCLHLTATDFIVNMYGNEAKKCSIVKNKYRKLCKKCHASGFNKYNYYPFMVFDKSGKMLHPNSKDIAYKGDLLPILVKTKFKYKNQDEFIFVLPYSKELQSISGSNKEIEECLYREN